MNESLNRFSQISLQVPKLANQHSLSSSQLNCRKAFVCLMPRPQTKSSSLTIGQLAKRLSVAEIRNRELSDAGWIAGVSRVPAVGRYRETVKTRNASIIAGPRDWFVAPATARPRAEYGRESAGASNWSASNRTSKCTPASNQPNRAGPPVETRSPAYSYSHPERDMVDIEREQLVSFAEAARRIPSSRVGRQLHPNTIWRWVKRGLKANNGQRVHLETIRIGGSNFTSVEALGRFFAALDHSSEPQRPATRQMTAKTRSQTAAAKLEDYGF
jgi:hypothetical protein